MNLISIIIPCFNEAARIEPVVDAGVGYFRSLGKDFEMILVNDGSLDNTATLLQVLSDKYPEVRAAGYTHNKGKGAAVRFGLGAAKGDVALVADADGAAAWDGFSDLYARLDEKTGAVCGARFGSRVVVNGGRKAFGALFRQAVRQMVDAGVEDTQCGFKVLNMAAARAALPLLECDGYAFDIELLSVLKRTGWAVKEEEIAWVHQAGSKVNVLRDGAKMLADTWRIRQRIKKT